MEIEIEADSIFTAASNLAAGGTTFKFSTGVTVTIDIEDCDAAGGIHKAIVSKLRSTADQLEAMRANAIAMQAHDAGQGITPQP